MLLNTAWKLHTPWRPQSSRRVERMNQTLKNVSHENNRRNKDELA